MKTYRVFLNAEESDQSDGVMELIGEFEPVVIGETGLVMPDEMLRAIRKAFDAGLQVNMEAEAL